MEYRRDQLVVKISSLAAEAQIIRRRENRCKQSTLTRNEQRRQRAREAWLSLKSHRRREVRSEARSALLAYAYLRGVPYRSVECKCHTQPDWARVERIVQRFLSVDVPRQHEHVKRWRETPVAAASLAA